MMHPLPALSELIEAARAMAPAALIARAESELFGVAAEIVAINDDCARPLPFHLQPMPRRLLWLIARRSPARPYLSRDDAYRGLYGLRPEGDQPDPKVIDVFLRLIRKALPPGIVIETCNGTGYRMPPAARAAFFQLAGVTE